MKKSRGTLFLEHFIDLRESNPSVFTRQVFKYLEQYDDIELSNTHWHALQEITAFKLSRSFFGQFNVDLVRVIPKTLKSKTLLIGKGVCYDTGGLNLKSHLDGSMFFDRNGALLAIAASLDHGVESLALFAYNRIGSGAVLPGAILDAGKEKILINNTDAEGRILLADGLMEAAKRKIRKTITLATLTGAAVGMVGERTMAVVHSNKKTDYLKLMKKTLSGSQFWPGPFHETYDTSVITKINGATIQNLSSLRYAGSSTAFSFLKRFYKGHLLHLDIAPMMTTAEGNGLVWGLKEVKTLIDL